MEEEREVLTRRHDGTTEEEEEEEEEEAEKMVFFLGMASPGREPAWALGFLAHAVAMNEGEEQEARYAGARRGRGDRGGCRGLGLYSTSLIGS